MSPNAPPTPLTITSIAAPYPAPTPQPGRRLTLLLLNTDNVKIPKNNAQTGPLVPVVCNISFVVKKIRISLEKRIAPKQNKIDSDKKIKRDSDK